MLEDFRIGLLLSFQNYKRLETFVTAATYIQYFSTPRPWPHSSPQKGMGESMSTAALGILWKIQSLLAFSVMLYRAPLLRNKQCFLFLV